MTEKSDPLENAIAERVNGILKDELLEKRFDTFREAREKIDQAVCVYTKETGEELLLHEANCSSRGLSN